MEKTVELPIFHFRKSAKREYSDWRQAIVREFYQNSVDAGATEIHFTLEDNILTVRDNGKGMSLEDCETKLLTMGGTDKTDQDIGGYGVAKQILYFAWPNWEIISDNYRIQGRGCRYNIEEHAHTKGVTSIVHLAEEFFNVSDIFDFLKTCDAKPQTFINGTEITTRHFKGRKIRELSWGTLYKAAHINGESISDDYLTIRVHGVTMFRTYISENPKCRLTIEMNDNARETLTSNRDGLKYKHYQEYQNLLNDIAANTKSALKEKPETLVTQFQGTGFTAVYKKEIIQQAQEAKQALTVDRLVRISQSSRPVKATTATFLDTQAPQESLPPTKPPQNIFDEESILEEKEPLLVPVFHPPAQEAPLLPKPVKRGAHPDIIVKSIGKIPKKFHPNTWQKKIKNTLALWQHILRQVLIDNNTSCTFGVGFTLDPEVRAEFLTQDGIPYFLLNPMEWSHKLNLSGKNGWYIAQELKQRAIHEIAHFAAGPNHNENFVLTIYALEANIWKSERTYKSFLKNKDIKFL